MSRSYFEIDFVSTGTQDTSQALSDKPLVNFHQRSFALWPHDLGKFTSTWGLPSKPEMKYSVLLVTQKVQIAEPRKKGLSTFLMGPDPGAKTPYYAIKISSASFNLLCHRGCLESQTFKSNQLFYAIIEMAVSWATLLSNHRTALMLTTSLGPSSPCDFRRNDCVVV